MTMTLCDNNLLDFGNIIFAVWHLLIGEICTHSLLICKITLSKSSYGFDRHISRSKTANLFAVYLAIISQFFFFFSLDTDLEFQTDPAILHHEFEKFQMENIFGVAPDLGIIYFTFLEASG